MAKLITNAKDIATAETTDLVFTYNELEGKSIKKFENRSTAERKVEMAILAAGDRAAHRGTKPNVAPQVEDGKAGAEDTTEAVETPKAPKADKPTTAKEKAPKEPKTPKAPKVKAEKAPKAPKEPKVKTPHDTLVSITDLGREGKGIRASSFRGQILATLVEAGAMSKSHLVLKHQLYTADVVSKFKRLGFVTETVVA